MDASHIYEVGAEDTDNIVSLSCRIKPRRVKVAKKVKQKKSKLLGCHLKYYNRATSLTTTSNDQDSNIPSIPCHAIFVFLDPILLGVMQVEFQNKIESPFETHTVQMQTFLTAVCIYSGVLAMQMTVKKGNRSGYQSQVLSYALLLAGALSSASLLSVLLLPQVLLVVLSVWGSIPLILSRHLLKNLVCWVIEMVVKLTRDVRNCKFATVVLISHNKDSAHGNTERVEGIV